MENTKSPVSKDVCSLSNTRMLEGENNEIICLKIYNGDWGDWDEIPQQCNSNASADTKSIKQPK